MAADADGVVYPPGFFRVGTGLEGERVARAHFWSLDGETHLSHSFKGSEGLPVEQWNKYLQAKHDLFVSEGHKMMSLDEVLASWRDLAGRGMLA